MRQVRLFSIVTFIMLWFLNFIVLKRFYDVSVYEEYLAFWNTRGILYDGMFFCISLILFISWNGLQKALACFMGIVTLGSFIDKAFFRVSGYLYGDIVLVILGIITSYIIWKRSKMS